MIDDTAPHEIARLEAQIEMLAESIERCRKISVAAKIALAGGALWFVLTAVWILPFAATPFVAALAATLGGIVLLGSNATTWTETEAALHKAEAARADLIGAMNLRLVGAAPPTLH